MRQKLKTYGFTICIFILGLNCSMSSVSISDIKGSPEEYRGQDVTVKGVIDEIISIPLVNIRVFNLKGYDDSIWIIGKAPATEGSEVVVKGTVDIAVRIADQNFGTVIRMDD